MNIFIVCKNWVNLNGDTVKANSKFFFVINLQPQIPKKSSRPIKLGAYRLR